MQLNKKLDLPCYAVIFSYQRSTNLEGYQEMDNLTLDLAKQSPGFLGYEVTGNGAEHAIFISYWQNMESIDIWRKNPIHIEAKKKGINQWYNWFHSMICKVEHANFSPVKI